MTPPRLIEFACPSCQATHWEIDCDYRGAELLGKKELSYSEREYILLQPHSMYPMTRRAFNYWAQVLREQFPDDPRVAKIGTTFIPNHRVLRARLSNLMLDRQYLMGRVRRQIRKWLGTGS